MSSYILSLWTIVLTLSLGVWTTPQALALTATPTSLNFQAVQGGANPASQSVTVSKSNLKTTNWSASNSASWVLVSPSTGSLAKTAQVTVTVNTTGLAPGTYSATVAVTAYKGGSISIPVSLTVTPSGSLTSPSTGTSTSASLSWSPSASTVAGYNVYIGTASGTYGTKINVGNVTSYVVSNLSLGTYFFVVTDYDSSGGESPPSNEVTKTIY
jgi:hypothetical protein